MAELIGGVLVLVGFLTPIVAILNVLVLLSAFVLGLAAALLLIAARGAGKFSIDALLPGSPYRNRS